MPERSLRIELGYAAGMLGWSILINIITVMLIYFYVPPNNSGMSVLIPQMTVFGIFTVLSLIAASGRLLDAVTDPVIAFMSDRFRHPRGRRIPFMAVALLPSVIFCVLIFFPYDEPESMANVWWLFLTQSGFYLFMTAYIVPYNALLPELAPDSDAKVRMSTWLSFAFVLGMIVSSQTPALAEWFEQRRWVHSYHSALKWSIAAEASLGSIFLAIPLLVLDEQRLIRSTPTNLPFGQAFRQILTNWNFLIFITADFSYFVSLTIISSGLLYILKVLLGLPESIGGQVMAVLVFVSLMCYPTVVRLTRTLGKRRLIVTGLWMQGLLLSTVYFFGHLPLSSKAQIFGLAILLAIPAALLGILPYAIIAETAKLDAQQTGQQKEAMYFAVRNFSTKLGQTLGIATFAILTIFGKDPGNDLGIRLAALFGAGLCLLAGVVFLRFREV